MRRLGLTLGVVLLAVLPASASARYLHVADAARASRHSTLQDNATAVCHHSYHGGRLIYCSVAFPATWSGMRGVFSFETVVGLNQRDRILVMSTAFPTYREPLGR